MEAANTLVNTVSTTAATNTNHGPADKELLHWHNRLGHIGMRKVQFLMQTGVTEFRQPLQVQNHLEMPGILVQLGHIQRT